MESGNAIDTMTAEIDLCEHLLLREISEPRENSLRLLIDEAVALPEEEGIELPGLTLTGRPIRSTEQTGVFELLWNEYIVYSIINESYCGPPAESEIYTGRLFRVFSKSRFLDHIAHATFATVQYPGPFRHYQLVCEWHVIDVASTSAPHIRWFRPSLNSRSATAGDR